ncbi:MAG: hypothetical protein F9K40_00600 [Kofleriaceae bacterium]|nr:MAG: hypothetical protein F9K40_00600 [Kofleriaceae bacterium]
MSPDLDTAVIVCLAALGAFAFVDGVLVHLVRERLHRRPETRLEHVIHTGRAAVFPPILLLFFAGRAPALGVALLVVDQVLEIADMAIERRSRAYSGGLRTSEYLLHGSALTLRGAAIAFSLAAGAPSAAVVSFVDLLLPGTVLGAILHVVLLVPIRRAATA